jgi:hypothetical protein
MRRLGLIVALGTLLGMCTGAVTAAPALAGGRGDGWQLTDAQPFTLDPSFCGFEVGVTEPVNQEFFKILKTSDGSMTFLITGFTSVSFTNLSTGKTITVPVPGAGTFTAFADGSALAASDGPAIVILAPADAQRFGLPTLSVTTGAFRQSVAPDGTITSLSLDGRVLVDVCAALS